MARKRPYASPQILQTEPLAPPEVETAGAENCDEGPVRVNDGSARPDSSRTSR